MLAVIFLTQISWGPIGLCGVLFVSQNNLRFRTLEAIVPSHSFAKNHSSPAAYLLLNFRYYIETSQAKSVYLGSGGGKNATTIALR